KIRWRRRWLDARPRPCDIFAFHPLTGQFSTMDRRQAYAALLRWQAQAGADEAIGEIALDRRAEAAAPKPAAAMPAEPQAAAPADAAALAAGAGTIGELAERLEAFDGCALKKTAMRLCL